MFKYYFERIENIEIAPIISLTIFFVFFILLIIRLYKMDNKHIEKMKKLPIDGSSSNKSSENNYQS